jgi:hypothetical protein
MPPPLSKWPELATSVETLGTSQDCILNVHVDAKTLYRHLEANKDLRIPAIITRFIQNTMKATDYLLRNPLGADWRTSIGKLEDQIIEIQKAVKAQATLATSVNQNTSYAQAAARAPSPGHAPSHGISALGATPMELRKDREVIVKLRSKEAMQRFRSMTPKQIRDKAERARGRAAKALGSPQLATAEIFAAGQLKSGDVQFVLGTAANAESLRQNNEWVKYLSNGASVRIPT